MENVDRLREGDRLKKRGTENSIIVEGNSDQTIGARTS